MRRKFIHVTRADREFLCIAFSVTPMTVYRALHYADKDSKQSLLARKIRKLAKERGGIVMLTTPEVETLHDADGYMRQYMPNGVMIEFNKADGCADIIQAGETVRHEEDVKINDILALQAWASAL